MANLVGTTNAAGSLPQAGGGSPAVASFDRQMALLVSELAPKYQQLGLAGKLFFAQAIVTAPVIFTTAAGTGGPFLWNPPSSGVVCSLVAAVFGITVVTTVAAALGITGGTGQNLIPASTTAIDGSGNCMLGGAASKTQAYRIGTPTTAGAFLIPFGHVHTGALTVDTTGVQVVDLWGMINAGPGSWLSIAASATASTTVGTFGLIYEELPL